MRFPSPAEAPGALIRPRNLQGFIGVGGSRCQPTGLPHRGLFHPALRSGLTLEKPLGNRSASQGCREGHSISSETGSTYK